MKNFSQLDLIDPLQRTLAKAGYRQPTPIQAKALPPAIEGRDVLGIAQTGTGKTAAFALPILNRLGREPRKSEPRHPFALILAPTRELAIQIGDSLAAYGRLLRLRICTIYGGVGQTRQVNQLKKGAHILVATPGRLLDLIGQQYVKLGRLEFFVLDEADRMLDMGFLPDLKRILRLLPKNRQSLFFSATIPPTIKKLAQELLTDPVSVTIAPKSVTIDKIKQRFLLVQKADKLRLLRNMLGGTDVDCAIVFTKTKRGANRLSENLEKSGIRALVIHGNKSQAARQKTLAAFRAKRVKVLVATDIAARGIDVEGVSHVVNFDLPQEPESYVHRIGRTGRAGANGIAVTFCLPEEKRALQAIERLIGSKLKLDSTLIAKDVSSTDAPRQKLGNKKRTASKRKPKTKHGVGSARVTKTSPGKKQAPKTSSDDGSQPTQRRKKKVKKQKKSAEKTHIGKKGKRRPKKASKRKSS